MGGESASEPRRGFDVSRHFRVVGLLTSLSVGAESTQGGSPLKFMSMFVDPVIPLGAGAEALKYLIIITASFTTLDSRTVV